VKLNEIFPPTGYSVQEADRIVYARDASEFEGVCHAVVWPTNKDQIINMIKFANKDSNNFTIRGAGTNTVGGCVPANTVVVDMSKMNKILEWDRDSVLVEAGVVLNDLIKAAKKKGLFFPIKPLEYSVCTIGGMIAMNTLGINTYYGKMEDWVTELEVIDGQGNRLKVSPQGIKNFAGLEGTTGIICTARLKLLPAPREKTVSLFKFNTITALMDKVMILDKNPSVMSIEFFDEAISIFTDLGQSLHLLVEYNNGSGLMKDQEEIAKLDELKEKMQHLMINKKYTQKEDPKIPLEQMGKFLNWLRKNDVPCFGHMKLRIVHPCFREFSKLPHEMYAIVSTVQGEVPGQYGIGIKRKKFLSKEKAAKYAALKQQYDPSKVLNRGVIND